MAIDFEGLLKSNNWEDRLRAAKAGYALDVLVHDNEWIVRVEVARQGYGLEMLIDDPHWCVRTAVAEQGYGLESLVHDKDWAVRKAVAQQGYGLDILAKDNERFISDLAKKFMGIVPRVVAPKIRDGFDKPLDEVLAGATERAGKREAGIGGKEEYCK